MQERQLDGVADLLDLPAQAADVVVADVGHLFEHQVLDLGLGDALEGVAGLGVDQQRVAGPQLARTQIVVDVVVVAVRQILGGHQRLGQPHDALLVGVADHERAVAVGRISRSVLISPTASKLPASTTVSASLSRTVWPCFSDLVSMLGEHVRRILRPEVNTSTVSSSCTRKEHAVAARRLTQPVDLLAERQQLLTGLLEGFHQLGVAGRQRVDPRLELVHITGAAQSALRTYRVLQLLAQ